MGKDFPKWAKIFQNGQRFSKMSKGVKVFIVSYKNIYYFMKIP